MEQHRENGHIGEADFLPDRLPEDGGFAGDFPANNVAADLLGKPQKTIDGQLLMSNLSRPEGLAHVEWLNNAARFLNPHQYRMALMAIQISAAREGRARVEVASVVRHQPELIEAQVQRERSMMGRLRRLLGRGQAAGE